MESTMQLLNKALSVQRAAAWVEDMNLSKSAISMAQKRGRLSPVLAGNLAIKLGENPEHWIAVAALEAEPESELLTRLRKAANSWRKL
ncbi:MAG: hypothetical protein Q8R06_17325 [Polaromonas sp.]|uniref:hypothetical protein n=1 Tax=Polaromonas sp. TaxID=1869339 RepID=UPI002732B9B9|nr:hypothetical protein [Polaromonas sp.]MDP3798878.1 hypothetical protein [Polaromonas sp.]